MTEQLGNDQLDTGGGRAKRSRRPSTRESQAKIGELAVKLFTDNPSAFWSFAPELANSIDQHLQGASSGRRRVPVFEGYMTEREREFKMRSLSELIDRYTQQGTLLLQDGQRALALAAALREHAAPHKKTLLEIVEQVIGVPLDSPGPEKVTFVKGKPEHHTFSLVRGLTLSLAWDGALIGVSIDPQEYRVRQRALSIVGIASDSRPDVASRHDEYLWNGLNE